MALNDLDPKGMLMGCTGAAIGLIVSSIFLGGGIGMDDLVMLLPLVVLGLGGFIFLKRYSLARR